MKKFKVKMYWESCYEIEVKAINEEEAEAKALESMENGECQETDCVYSSHEIKEIK